MEIDRELAVNGNIVSVDGDGRDDRSLNIVGGDSLEIRIDGIVEDLGGSGDGSAGHGSRPSKGLVTSLNKKLSDSGVPLSDGERTSADGGEIRGRSTAVSNPGSNKISGGVTSQIRCKDIRVGQRRTSNYSASKLGHLVPAAKHDRASSAEIISGTDTAIDSLDGPLEGVKADVTALLGDANVLVTIDTDKGESDALDINGVDR